MNNPMRVVTQKQYGRFAGKSQYKSSSPSVDARSEREWVKALPMWKSKV